MLLSYVGYSPYVTVEGHPILGHPTQLQVLPVERTSHPFTHTQSFSPKLSQQIYKYINTSEAPSHQVELRNSSVHLTSQVEMVEM